MKSKRKCYHVKGEERLMKASEVCLEDSYGSISAALIGTNPVMERHDGFCVVNIAVGKEQVWGEDGGAVEDDLIGTAQGAGVGDSQDGSPFSTERIRRREFLHHDALFST